MTREEAITILEGLVVPIHAEPAFDMAIEALKTQENIIPLDSEDIIFVTTEEYKAQNTARIIYNFLKKKIGSKIIDNPFEFEDWYNRMIWHVQEYYRLKKKYESGGMVEPKTGEWVEIENGEYLCSNCSRITIGYPPKNCPNYGADMRGDTE